MLAFHQNAIDSLDMLHVLHMKWKYGTELSIWINVFAKVKFRERKIDIQLRFLLF